MNDYSTLAKWAKRFEKVVFFVLNKHRFKRLEPRALITKPLRIEGARYISIYKGALIKDYSWIAALRVDEYEPELIINEGCSLGDFNHIAAVRKVILGRNVLTANRVYISDNLHGFEDIHTPIMHQPIRFKGEVYIGDGSWIGENACIIGAKIGKNCVIGANAVVTNDVPDYSVAVGAPARVVKQYNPITKKWERTGDQDERHDSDRFDLFSG